VKGACRVSVCAEKMANGKNAGAGEGERGTIMT
jgi:hypothetical protein